MVELLSITSVTNLLLVGFERIFKIGQYLVTLWGIKLTAWSALCVGALSCWKMKNSLEIWRMAAETVVTASSYDNRPRITFILWSTCTSALSTTRDSPTDAVSHWLNVDRVLSPRLSSWLIHASTVCRVTTVNVFSSVNKMMLMSLDEYGWV